MAESDQPQRHDLAQKIPPISFETGQEQGDSQQKQVGYKLESASSDLEKVEPEDPSPAPAIDFPDGGWRAWCNVGGAWCISFTSWGFTNSFGVFQTYYQDHQLADKTPSDISWIGSCQLATVLLCAIFAGKLFDAGKIKYLLFTATLLYAAGLFGLSCATEYWQIFLAQGIACGLASGIAFLPAASSVSHWFKHRRATALGVLATGSSVGGVVYPIMLNRLFTRIGFAWTVRAAGFLTLGLLAIANLTVNSRLPPRKIEKIFDFRPLKETGFLLFVLGETIIMWGIYSPYFYVQDYAIEHGVSPNLAFYALSILNAASVLGRIIPNWLADTYGPLTILIPNCALSGILIFLFLPMCRTEAGVVVFSVLFGIASGAYVSMMPATVASMTKNMAEVGHRTATMFLVVSITALTGTPITGAIIVREGGSYIGAFVCSGVFVLVGTAFIMASWWVVSREKGTRWV
ncbi:MCT family MFS transporter [Sporobolomyces koalae]|uniref:MCT family MFS transporter n=1 Tax=Sporobolomyces koalae TaxID=500713 RepID=UPI0031767924